MQKLFSLRLKDLWYSFKSQHFAFWSISAYLAFEYVRPQSIIKSIDILPWGQITLILTLLGILSEKYKPKVDPAIGNLLILYFVIILLSSTFAYDSGYAFSKLKDYYIWVISYLMIVYSVTTAERFFLFIALFILFSFKISFSLAKVWAMRGFAFADWGLMGPPGFFQNSGELAIQMLVLFGISFYFAKALRPYTSKIVGYVLMLVPITAIMTVLGASSRGAQLGLAIQILFIYKWQKLSFKYLIIGAAIVSLAYNFLPEEQKARFSEAGDDKTSVQRLLYWEHGYEMIKDNPILGVGFYNFVVVYNEKYSADTLFGSAQLPHNIFIQIGTDTGLLGLIVILFTILAQFKMNWRLRKKCDLSSATDMFYFEMSRGLDLALMGFLVAGQFVTVTYYPFFWINLALVTALNTAFYNDKRLNKEHANNK